MKKNLLFLVNGLLLLIAMPVAAGSFDMPFSPQAPYGDWRQPWQDACEETAIMMVHNYYGHRGLNPEDAKHGILQIFNVKHKFLGQSLDEDAEMVAYLINNFLPWEAELVYQPTVQQIKNELDLQRPVIVPASGKDLGNPNFQGDGPSYHMLILSGYDDAKQEFITQDPGTSVGHNYRYPYSVIMNANHDFVDGNVRSGMKVMLFTRGTVDKTAHFDGDKDGLGKADELRLGTNLGQSDTDHDGYLDGEEVRHGYSPLEPAQGLANLTPIKSPFSDRIYIYENKQKRHVLSLTVWLKYSPYWRPLQIVSQDMIDMIVTGPVLSQ